MHIRGYAHGNLHTPSWSRFHMIMLGWTKLKLEENCTYTSSLNCFASGWLEYASLATKRAILEGHERKSKTIRYLVLICPFSSPRRWDSKIDENLSTASIRLKIWRRQRAVRIIHFYFVKRHFSQFDFQSFLHNLYLRSTSQTIYL